MSDDANRLLKAAKAYWESGLTPIICAPRSKRPIVDWRAYQDARPTPDDLEEWWRRTPDGNLALVMGRGIFAVDLDGPGAEQLLEDRGIKLPAAAPRSVTGKGQHVFLAAPGPVPNRTRLIGDGVRQVDIRGDGGIVVVPPSIHPTGAEYRWQSPLDLPLPEAPEALLELIRGSSSKPGGDGAPVDWVSEALLEGVEEGRRDDTCTRLAGVFIARGFAPEAVTEILAEVFAPRCRPPFPPADVEKCVMSVAKADASRREPDPAIQPVDALALLDAKFPERPALIPGLLDRESFTILGGAPKVGKSLLTATMAISIATGRPWLGFPTVRGRVLVIQAEMPPRRMQERLALMLSDLKSSLEPGWLSFFNDRSLRMDTPEGQGRIRRYIEDSRPDLLIIDPLARLMTGDENSGQNMGRVIAFIDELIQTFGVAVVLVHHTGKPNFRNPRDGGDSLRGHSSLWAAVDLLMMLSRKSKGGLREYLLTFDARYDPEREPLQLRPMANLWFEESDAVPQNVRLAAELATGVSYSSWVDTIKKKLEVSEATAKRLIKEVRARDLVDEKSSKRNFVFWFKGSTDGTTDVSPTGTADGT